MKRSRPQKNRDLRLIELLPVKYTIMNYPKFEFANPLTGLSLRIVNSLILIQRINQ